MAHFINDNDVVQFSIELDGKKKNCWISREALEDHFGATTRESAVQVLHANMDRIAPVAAKVARATPEGELVRVTTKHF